MQFYAVFSIYFLRDYYVLYKGDSSEKKNYLSLIYGIVFLLLFFMRIIFGFVDFYSDYPIDYAYDPEYALLWRFGYFLQVFGLGLVFILIHKRLIRGKDKYILVIIYYLLFILSMNPFDVSQYIFALLLNVFSLFIPFAYLYVAIKSIGKARRKASYVSFGMIIYAIANILTFNFIKELIYNSNIIEYFTYLTVVFLILSLGCCLLFIGFAMKITTEDLRILGEEKTLVKAIGLDLSRRNEITEEEVSISKEKKICLVCKGKISRFNSYFCPDCDTLYCENCAQSLLELENACWVCNAPFDESKPSKPFEKFEAEVEIESKDKK